MYRRLIYALLPLLLSACSSTLRQPEELPRPQSESQDTTETPTAASFQQRYAAALHSLAIAEYQQGIAILDTLLNDGPASQHNLYHLHLATALIESGQYERARQPLEQIQPETVAAGLLPLYQLLSLYLDALDDPAQVMNARGLPEPGPIAESGVLVQFYALRGRLFEMRGEYLKAADDYLRRTQLLDGQQSIQINHGDLWKVLQRLSPEALELVLRRRYEDDPTARGWIELASISHTYHDNDVDPEQALVIWLVTYRNHPAATGFLESIRATPPTSTFPLPANIAILLPQSGKFARAGAAIRDGLLSAYYQDNLKQQTSLRFFDSGADANSAIRAYAQAVLSDADAIIGPLAKEDVEAISQLPNHGKPTLLLNASSHTTSPITYALGLAPEDEVRQAAFHAWQNGHHAALLLAPDNEYGERLATAFRDQWEALGGVIRSASRYPPKQNDYANAIKSMLAIDASERRRYQIASLLNRAPEFVPRRRQDVDFIFLVAFPRQARLIHPQLKFHHAGGLPVLATSHLFSGTPDPDRDRDIDGAMFVDTAWTLHAASATGQQRERDYDLLARHSGALQRLVALGFDAYNLVTGKLQQMETGRGRLYPGETGRLRLDASGNIERKGYWAMFSKGQPQIVE